MSTANAELFLGHAAMVDEDYDSALAHYSSAIEIEPNNADCYSKRAAAQLKRSRYTEAASDATASIKLEPSPKAYLRKGLACFALQEYESARAAFGKAIQMEGSGGLGELKRWMRKCDAELHLEKAGPAPAAAATSGASPAATAAPMGSTAAGVHQPVVDPSRVRHEWYQTNTHVVVSILARQVAQDKVSVQFEAAGVGVTIELERGAEYQLNLSLFQKIMPDECKFAVSATKVELTMRKQAAGKWESLEGEGEGELQVASVVDASAAPSKGVYSGSKKDWNNIETDLKRQEEEEKPEGEEALNKLFRDIYGKANEDTRRAMNKSFQTSGGTVLSTNWGEVAAKDYEKDRTAPEGQEWKKWG